MKRCDRSTAIAFSLYGSQCERFADRHSDVRKGKRIDSTCTSSPEQARELPNGVVRRSASSRARSLIIYFLGERASTFASQGSVRW
jgi:hypothetical protein